MRTARRIIRLLKSKRVTVEKKYLRGGYWGFCKHEDAVLVIGKHLCEATRVTVVIHECLHYLNPEKSERWVLAEERKVFDGLLHSEYLEFVELLKKIK